MEVFANKAWRKMWVKGNLGLEKKQNKKKLASAGWYEGKGI